LDAISTDRCHPVFMSQRFVHLWWHEEDIHYYVELDDDAYIKRDVEIDPSGEVTSAASRDDWNRARDYGDLYEYQAKWGLVGEGQVLPENVPNPSYSTPIAEREFEEHWDAARRARAARWDTGGRDEYERTRNAQPKWKPLKGEGP
jgi:hypothetical protein